MDWARLLAYITGTRSGPRVSFLATRRTRSSSQPFLFGGGFACSCRLWLGFVRAEGVRGKRVAGGFKGPRA